MNNIICFPIDTIFPSSYHNFLDRGLLLTRKLLNPEFQMVKLKSSLRNFYGRHHELVHRYGITIPQLISDMFLTSLLQSPSLFMNVIYRIRLFTGFVITRATRRVPHVEQDLLTLPEHLRSPLVFLGGFVLFILQLPMLCHVCCCLFVFFIFGHGVVS